MPSRDNSDSRPARPTGSGHEARFHQWVWDQLVHRGTLIDTPQIRFEQTTKGVRPILRAAPGGGSGIQGPFLLQSVKGDYLVCKLWDGIPETANVAAAENGPDVYIAKQNRLRHSILGEQLEGVNYYYSYPGDGVTGLADNVNRFGAVGADGICLSRIRKAYSNAARTTLVENHVVTPEWIPSDLFGGTVGDYMSEMIWAFPAITGVWRTVVESSPGVFTRTNPVELLMVDDGRAWALHA